MVAVGELLCQGCFFIESDFRLVMGFICFTFIKKFRGDDPV